MTAPWPPYARAAAAMAACACTLLLAGCGSDVRSIDERAFLAVMAVDRSDTGPGIDVTVVIPNPRSAPAGAPAARNTGDLPANILLHASGPVLGKAMDLVNERQSRLLEWRYLSFLLLGEEAVSTGIFDLVETPIRDPRVPIDGLVAVIREGRADQALQGTSPPLEQYLHVHLSGLFLEAEQNVVTTRVPLWKLYSWLVNPGVDAYLPALRSAGPGRALFPDGIAIFRGTRLAGYLEREEAHIFLLLRGVARRAALAVTPPGLGPTEGVTLRLTHFKVRPRFTLVDGRPHVELRVWVRADIEGSPVLRFTTGDLGPLRDLERQTAALIEERAHAVIRRLQEEFGADVFAWGQQFRARFPQWWDAETWPLHFAQAGVEVHVQAELASRGNVR